jgi:hypothetical protein
VHRTGQSGWDSFFLVEKLKRSNLSSRYELLKFKDFLNSCFLLSSEEESAPAFQSLPKSVLRGDQHQNQRQIRADHQLRVALLIHA